MRKIEKKELTFGAAIPSCADLVGKDILIIGYAGRSGAKRLAEANKEVILARFAPIIYNKAIEPYERLEKSTLYELLSENEALCAIACNIGGVEGALFDIANSFSVGIEVITKDIPIKQETIEICNLLDVNPYKLYSIDSYIVFTSDGKKLSKTLEANGLYAKPVGRVTKGLDKVFLGNEERSFITPSRGKDEIYKYIPKGELL